MKNLTFALACASTFALFAAIDVPKADFENYAVGAKVSDTDEPDKQFPYWLYEGASGSDDGSTVKAYGDENLAAPAGSGQNLKYLELSTEGGTLWRSLAAGNPAGTDIAGKLGAAQVVPDGGLYIDTMVQFTPTEDGGAPEVAKDNDGNYIDKLAIWLDVNSETGTTNLCVLARSYDYNGSDLATDPTRYTLVAADGSEMAIQPGVWYQLTVKATKIVANASLGMIPGFQIFVDGKAMKATKAPVSEALREVIQSLLSEENSALLARNELFPSLATMGGGEDPATLQAVGFKGSGALDNLSISETEPQPTPGPEFAVDWGESGVTAVWGATPPTAAELAAIQAWATANGLSAAQVAGETGAAAYLLGMTTVPSEVPALSITSIDQTAGGWTVTVACSAQPDLSKVNGKLTVKTATSLGEAWTVQTYNASNLAFADGKAVITVTAETARFMKAALTR